MGAGVRPGPRRVAVVGAGIAGLATTWFLQERGIEVELLDRDAPGAGASWGNAGWLAPAVTTPLPAPAMLRHGVRALLDPRSPVSVPPRADPRLWRFLGGFARHCTASAHRRATAAYRDVNGRALDAYDELAAGGVAEPTRAADPFLICVDDPAARDAVVAALAEAERSGQKIGFELVDGARARELSPVLSGRVTGAVLLHDQRYVDPARFVAALAEAVVARGAVLRASAEVVAVHDLGDRVLVHWRHDGRADDTARYDAVVLATGAWSGDLARGFGVRTPVQAGRGYSFSVPVDGGRVRGPVYLPDRRVACTPCGDRLRIAGTMEFRAPGEPADPRRIRAIVDAVRPVVDGVDLDDRQDEWVGSRPCTPDGLPLVGPTSSPRVFVSGGHGMWGMVLGPLSGRLLAESVATGRVPDAVRPFRPTR